MARNKDVYHPQAAGAGTAEVVGAMQFATLVEALKAGDKETAHALRKHWELIVEYVQEHDEETGLPPDKQAALILWLSTPPDRAPTQGPPSFVRQEREGRVAAADQLWHSWAADGQILRELDTVLSGAAYGRRQEWLENARLCFERGRMEGLVTGRAAETQTRLDVLAGYGAALERLLLDERTDFAKARVEVFGCAKPPTLAIPERRAISTEELGKAIASRSRVAPRDAEHLARAISLSLPAHGDVLPTFTAEVGRSRCTLLSTREDPLAGW
jgi:hypothetical protein